MALDERSCATRRRKRLLARDGRWRDQGGRGRAVPPGYFPPKTYCAAVIAEAWSFVHDVEPAPKNQKAAAAAHLLWSESLEGLSMEETKLALEWMLAKDAKKSWGEPALAQIRALSLAAYGRDARRRLRRSP